MIDCFTFPKLSCFVKQKIFYFFTTQNLGAVAADLLYKSVPELSQEPPDICQSQPYTTSPLYDL